VASNKNVHANFMKVGKLHHKVKRDHTQTQNRDITRMFLLQEGK